jgi:hypothetical protein
MSSVTEKMEYRMSCPLGLSGVFHIRVTAVLDADVAEATEKFWGGASVVATVEAVLFVHPALEHA